jgi:ATP-dependent Zn protease
MFHRCSPAPPLLRQTPSCRSLEVQTPQTGVAGLLITTNGGSGATVLKANNDNDNPWAGVVVLPPKSTIGEAKDETPTGDWLAARRVNIADARLDDLVGLTAAKREIAGLAARLSQRQAIIEAGASVTRGAILSGPPGCGKTSLARALAALLGPDTSFYELGAAEVTADRIRGIGDVLRDRAEERVVLFLDECDFLLDRDAYQHTESTRSSLFAALSVLDGLQPHDSSVWLAATNRSMGSLDRAATRSGRLGIHISVEPPSLPEREELFARCAQTRSVAHGISWRRAAELIGPSASPADIISCLDDALALAFADGLRLITQAHLDESLRRAGKIIERVPLVGRPRWARAVHESGHCLVGWLLGLPVSSLVIDGPLGGVTATEGNDPRPMNDHAARLMMRVAMAGRAAESVLLEPGEFSLGAYADIDQATNLAVARANSGTLPGSPVINLDLKPGSARVADSLASAIENAIAEEQRGAEALLRDHVVALQAFASIAERHDVMGADEIRTAFIACGLPPRQDPAVALTKADLTEPAAPVPEWAV